MNALALADQAPRRSALRWHGGKWRLAPWIIAHFPPHRCYVEPYGGAASVLLRKPRAYAEIYNDLDDDVVGLFRVLQDPAAAARLKALLEITPFARREFELSYDLADDPVERARRLIIRAFMGFGSNAHASTVRGHRSTGFRGDSTRSGATPAHGWAGYPDALDGLVARFRGVVIEHRDAAAVMAKHDAVDTLHYVDPPYLHDTRAPGNGYDLKYRMYRHEMDRAAHVALLAFLPSLTGMVVLSGYPSALYDDALPGWERVETRTHADGARPRTECLWINPAAATRRRAEAMPLFGAAPMLTFKAMPVPNGPPTWRVLAGATVLGTISNPGPSAESHSWHGVAPDGTRFSSTSRPKLAEQLQAHARKDLCR